MDKATAKMAIKTFLKGMRVDKEVLEGVDRLFAINWSTPTQLEMPPGFESMVRVQVLGRDEDGDPYQVQVTARKGKLPENLLAMIGGK